MFMEVRRCEQNISNNDNNNNNNNIIINNNNAIVIKIIILNNDGHYSKMAANNYYSLVCMFVSPLSLIFTSKFFCFLYMFDQAKRAN